MLRKTIGEMEDQKLFSEHIYGAELEEFKKHWLSDSDFKTANMEIITKPFKIGKILKFLRDEEFIKNLKSELGHCKYIPKVLDLYQFKKTEDLFCSTDQHIQMLNKAFRNDLMLWMSRNTNIELNEKVLMSSTRYYDTDHLLCHDDNMDDRRIAYILYLTPDWSEEDGGSLDLFDTDEKGSPRNVVKSLIPEYNSLVFFEVVENSYHQVSEVLTKDKCRLSINGWFHGPLKKVFHKERCEPIKIFVEPSSTKVNLYSWISDIYLKPSVMGQIQGDIEHSSYVFIQDFLKKSVYQQIANELTSPNVSWRIIGPPDMHRYEVADEQTLPQLLKDFCDLFKSISFFQLLRKYTGLDLVPEKTKRPKMTLEIQRWSSGCYTMLYNKSLLKNTLNESIKADRPDDDVSVDDTVAPARASTSDLSTDEINLDVNGTRRELKRERIDDSPPFSENSFDKRKIAKYPDSQSGVGMQFSSKHEDDLDKASSSSDKNLSRSGTPISNNEDDFANKDEFLLDVMIHFNTQDTEGKPKVDDTIDFVDPDVQEGILIEVPILDNHLCLVYRSFMICCFQKYLNHFYDGYFYTFRCTYHE